VLGFVPNIIVAVALIGLGWLIGDSFEKVIRHGVKSSGVDEFAVRVGLRDGFSRIGLPLNIGAFLGALVKWFIFISFLVTGFQVGGMTEAGTFVNQVIAVYIPKMFLALIVLYFAVLGAEIIRKISFVAISSFGLGHARFPSIAVSYAFVAAAVFFILSNLGIDPEYLKIIFIGFVAAMSLAFGLAFGFGGREVAEKLCEKIYKDTKKEQ